MFAPMKYKIIFRFLWKLFEERNMFDIIETKFLISLMTICEGNLKSLYSIFLELKYYEH